MLYTEFLKNVTNCQFCSFDDNKIIKSNKETFLTYSLAPYSKHHLLVIPHRHVECFEDLNKEEKKSIDDLLSNGIKLLKVLGHGGYTILLRSGENIGKSVKHLHYHIVPSMELGIENNHQRKIMNEEEINQLLMDFKNAELKIK